MRCLVFLGSILCVFAPPAAAGGSHTGFDGSHRSPSRLLVWMLQSGLLRRWAKRTPVSRTLPVGSRSSEPVGSSSARRSTALLACNLLPFKRRRKGNAPIANGRGR